MALPVGTASPTRRSQLLGDAPTLVLVRSCWRESRPRAFAFLASLALGALATVGQVLAIGAIVGALPAAIRHGANSSAAHSVELRFAILAGFVVLQQLVVTLETIVAGDLARRIELGLRERVMRAVLGPATVGHLEDPVLQDGIAAATTVGTARYGPIQAVTSFVPVASSTLNAVGLAIVVGTFRWWLGLGLVLVWLPLRRRLRADNADLLRTLGHQSPELRRSNYFMNLAMTPAPAKEIRVFGLAGWLVERFHLHWLEAMRSIWSDRRGKAAPLLVLLGIVSVASLGAFLVAVRAAEQGQIGVRTLVILLQAILGIAALGGTNAVDDLNFQYGTATIPAVADLEERLAPSETRASEPAFRPTAAVQFAGVHFRYPNHPGEVFAGLNLEIPVGQSLAIVGENGVGKTTLVKLLCGLVEPTAGAVFVDGRELNEIEPTSWRRQFGVVFQDFLRFLSSAGDNVRLAALDFADGGEDGLREVANLAALEDVLALLPAGWETPLSRQLTGGVDLSGGQWQRIALARALWAVRAGASILVLDEPTANLDIRSEAAFYERFLEMTGGLTTVLISHRFATVRRADRICVLADGVVAELGSHDELMAANGRYAHFFRLQSEAFEETSVESDRA